MHAWSSDNSWPTADNALASTGPDTPGRTALADLSAGAAAGRATPAATPAAISSPTCLTGSGTDTATAARNAATTATRGDLHGT